ncbi:unnamed protein product, partial [Phaeothamnion confervicola]
GDGGRGGSNEVDNHGNSCGSHDAERSDACTSGTDGADGSGDTGCNRFNGIGGSRSGSCDGSRSGSCGEVRDGRGCSGGREQRGAQNALGEEAIRVLPGARGGPLRLPAATEGRAGAGGRRCHPRGQEVRVG